MNNPKTLFEVLYFVNINNSNFNNIIDHSNMHDSMIPLSFFLIPKVAKNVKYV